MPFSIYLSSPPLGFAISSGREGDQGCVAYREFTSSEDGDKLIARLEGFPSLILGLLPKDAGIQYSSIDHLVVIVEPAGTTTVYVNELPTRARVRARRSVEKGESLSHDDFVDIEELRFGEVEVPPDAGILIVFSQGWRKGLYYDFGPLNHPAIRREYDLWKLLGSLYNYLTFQHVFKVTEDEWRKLLDVGWFPFVGLRQTTVKALLGHIQEGWNADDLVPAIADELRVRLPALQSHWQRHSLLAQHEPLLAHAAERFLADDFVSCITAVRLKREQIQLLFGGEAVGTVVAAPKGLLQGHLLEKRDRQDL